VKGTVFSDECQHSQHCQQSECAPEVESRRRTYCRPQLARNDTGWQHHYTDDALDLTEAEVSRRLGQHRHTVAKYLKGSPPAKQERIRTSKLSPHYAYLRERLAQGCRNGKVLLREIQKKGYPGSYHHLLQSRNEFSLLEEKFGMLPTRAPIPDLNLDDQHQLESHSSAY
jgi:hypothetical protein